MLETYRFRFVGFECAKKDPDCPILNQMEFTTIIGTDGPYHVYMSTSNSHLDTPNLGHWFAACPKCQSHHRIEKLS